MMQNLFTAAQQASKNSTMAFLNTSIGKSGTLPFGNSTVFNAVSKIIVTLEVKIYIYSDLLSPFGKWKVCHQVHRIYPAD
jgi:hypothetical protein